MIGVDVGGTKMNAALIHEDGRIEDALTRKTKVGSQEEFLAELDELIEKVHAGGRAAALGLGLPSTIDQRAGRIISSANIPCADLDVRARMTERFGLPTAIDNDGNAAAIAEWKIGAGRGADNLVLLTLGTGIGGGLILDGRPFRGATGAGAELGHMVVHYGGRKCPCGGTGHFETVASGQAADRVARELLGEGSGGAELVVAADHGDEAAVEALVQIGRELGAGIASLINIFEPEVVVIGGGFGQAGELLIGPAQEVVAREALLPGRDTVRIVPAELGPRAGLVGAGFVAYEALV